MPGFLDTGNLSARKVLKAGRAKTTTTYAETGRRASLDSLLVQPEIEHLVLGGDDGGRHFCGAGRGNPAPGRSSSEFRSPSSIGEACWQRRPLERGTRLPFQCVRKASRTCSLIKGHRAGLVPG